MYECFICSKSVVNYASGPGDDCHKVCWDEFEKRLKNNLCAFCGKNPSKQTRRHCDCDEYTTRREYKDYPDID